MKDEFHQSKNNSNNITTKDSSSNNNVNKNTSIKVMDWVNDSVIMRDDTDDTDHAESLVDNFFINIDRSNDSTINLCKLADLNYRLYRAKKKTEVKIQRQVQVETKRNADYTKDYNNRQDNIKNYVNSTEEPKIYKFLRELKVALAAGII